MKFKSSPQRNTFQAVLASSDSSSYAVFLYPEDGLQFYSTHSKNDNAVVPATVGFSQPSTYFILWVKAGSYNIIANDEEILRNLCKYVVFIIFSKIILYFLVIL